MTQRLRLIDVYNVPRLSMTYNKVHFAGPDIVSTFVKVYDVRQPPPSSQRCSATCESHIAAPLCTHTHTVVRPHVPRQDRKGGTPCTTAHCPLCLLLLQLLTGNTARPTHILRVLQVYFLHYRGVTFTFLIPKEYHSLYANSNDMPLELPVRHTSPVSAKHAT